MEEMVCLRVGSGEKGRKLREPEEKFVGLLIGKLPGVGQLIV